MRSVAGSCAPCLGAVIAAIGASGLTADAAPAAAPSAAAARCVAQLHGRAHLRPEAQLRATGPALTAGTKVEVLQNVPLTRRGLSLFQVRVIGSGATGYLFLRDTEFGRGCPLVWPAEEFKQPNQPLEPDLNNGSCYQRGVHASIKELFSPSCQEEGSSEPLGDGPPIKLEGGYSARLESYGPREEFGLLLHDKQGWRAYSFGDYGSDRHAFGWDAPIHAGPAVYLVFSDTVDYEEDGDVEHSESYSLYRVLGDGRVFAAMSLYINVGKTTERSACTLRGNADASVTFRCRPGRTQTFRWDAAVNKLVPARR